MSTFLKIATGVVFSLILGAVAGVISQVVIESLPRDMTREQIGPITLMIGIFRAGSFWFGLWLPFRIWRKIEEQSAVSIAASESAPSRGPSAGREPRG
jgi:hypothetical protein